MLEQVSGAALRDDGCERVIQNNASWSESAVEAVRLHLQGREAVTAETIRSVVQEHCGEPSHQNAWGGLTLTLVRSGILLDTGLSIRAGRGTAHARRLPIWRVAAAGDSDHHSIPARSDPLSEA